MKDSACPLQSSPGRYRQGRSNPISMGDPTALLIRRGGAFFSPMSSRTEA